MKKKKQLSKKYKILIIITSLIIILSLFLILKQNSQEQVLIKTNYGDIKLELYSEKSPITVANFKLYIKDEFYNNLVFHRIMEGFMIQGGGFDINKQKKETKSPIKLESNNGLSNEKYTIAMARTPAPDSATSQFFINTKDNYFLDYGVRDQGYAVFGKVIDGKEVVDKIEKIPTDENNWPTEKVIIEEIKLL